MGFQRNGFYFQQDNDSKHTYNVNLLRTPPQILDLNPIENLWAYFNERERQHTILSKTNLKKSLQEEWGKISVEMCQNLGQSMPRRLKVIKCQKSL